jgi:hypothetical protein
MSIPLDRLYHFIKNVIEKLRGDPIIIYRFYPHGSKNIENLNVLYNKTYSWEERNKFLQVYCNDQEPLDYEFYSKNLRNLDHNAFVNLLKSIGQHRQHTNLNFSKNWFEKNLLLHSEKRSPDLEKYQQDNQLIPVYYWNHAVLALDWFRYARHATFRKRPKKTFLIYNRAWSGTREYRLKFCDLLIDNNLINHCQTSFNPVDPEANTHYASHTLKNICWRPTHSPENFIQPTTATANDSADFNVNDYEQTNIEVVLETLFDDSRLHLTEKSLRPIACGQPFILAATHGSLEYLRKYGFKTFGHIWNEDYDLETDASARLNKIVVLMREISDWQADVFESKIRAAQEIADYNQQWFHSPDFFNLIVRELQNNLELALCELESCKNYQPWVDHWTLLLTYPEVVEFLKQNQDQSNPTLEMVDHLMKLAQIKLAQNL